ncbi:cation:proton antiporter [Enterobacter roggenkampii]|uniref:cation:proton antiporter n=1 Tax=Enterobacter roggenkampii TaxID=1812935 RepID=UPI002378433D|nr:cation:proton antiporter [Enterobacter roggenkampii]MDD9242232.1 cation:proton antiporter [Enterobacter roggenkampii]
MQGLLGTTLILLAACSLAAMATAAFRVPALLGYLSVGVVLGPSVIGVIAPGETLSFLSELGVALLLFMVGLEFSLGDFWLARRTVLMAGALQMIAVAPPLILLLMWLGQPGQSAALLGTAAAMSSTALVSRQLADQGELTTRHGRSAIAVLVFQDLASVPLLALLAIWARGESPKIEHVLLEVFGVLLLFAAAALVSRRLLHGLLGWVARRGHEESFVLVSLCVVVAAAAAAHAVGVSAALGAFLAGMVLGEILRHAGVAHLLLEADAQKVEAARAAGAPVFHGDASRPDTLLAAGLTHAHLVVLTFAHAQQALRIAQAIAERRPALTLWVSCRSTTAADAFRAMPNVRVYQQSFAAAIGLAEQVMSTLGMSTELIEGHISAMRRRLDSSRFPGSS